MFANRYVLRTFDVLPLAGRIDVLTMMLETLAHANELYLRMYPRTPLLYESGTRYLHEPDGVDDWQDIPFTLAVRSGDCEDLASWRVAELRHAGEAAAFNVTAYESPGMIDFHMRVTRADGSIEDPSLLLGMKV